MLRTLIPGTLFLVTLVPAALIAQDARHPEALANAYMQAWAARDVDAIAAFFADDGVYEDVTNVGNGWATPWRGREAIREAVRELYAGLPDLAFEWSVRTGHDLVVVEWTMTGTHTGDWPNLRATGRTISVPGVSVIELEGETIRRQRDYWDGFLFSSQLGVLPTASETRPGAVTPVTGETRMTTPEENKQIVRRAVAEGVNAQDLQAFRDMLAPDYSRHSQATAEMPEIRGADQMLTMVQGYFAAFPDWREEIDLMIAEGDKVAYITTGTGTHLGPLGDIPPTGKTVEVTNYIVQRFENGKIAETWAGWDNLAVLTQLGLLPPAEQGSNPRQER